MPKESFEWDDYSDQPAVIRDKKRRLRLYRAGAWGTIKTAASTLYLLFFSVAVYFKPRHVDRQDATFLGLCVNIDTPLETKADVSTDQLKKMVDELNVEHLLIRIPLADIEQLEKYIEFITTFNEREIAVNILQDRRHIEDRELRKSSLEKIFTRLDGRVKHYQIGNAVNRRKWAFTSLDEYFTFFSTAYQLKQQRFPHITLLGGSIIDFEPPNLARALYHRYNIHYDGVASQLYVDRRGAPENRQLGCDLLAKITWFKTLTDNSKKTGSSLCLTETNWPLRGTEPFAPAVGGFTI